MEAGLGKFGTWIVVALLLAIAVSSGMVFWYLGLGINVCQVDDRIPASDREAAEQTSLAFIDLLRRGETTAVIENMSRAGQSATERASVVNLVEAAVAVRIETLQPRKTFSLWSFAAPRGYTGCVDSAGVAFVQRGGGPHTMFTVIAEPIAHAERAWSFWLERENGSWRVRGVHVGFSVLAGRDGADLWALAEEERRQNHMFNATALYDVANMTLYRGAFLQIAEANGFAQTRQRWRRHEDIVGSRFNLGRDTFAVSSLTALSTDDGAFVLVMDQAIETPVEVSEAIKQNRRFIDAMNAERAEWRQVFDALAIGTPTGPHRVWRTVYRRDGGYVDEPPAPPTD